MSPMAESSETVVPQTQKIGKWRVVRALGKGGMAEVYEVEEDPATGRPCIVMDLVVSARSRHALRSASPQLAGKWSPQPSGSSGFNGRVYS